MKDKQSKVGSIFKGVFEKLKSPKVGDKR